MIPIDGVLVLERGIISPCDQGFTDIIITVFHLGSIIMDHFGDGEKYGITIEYFNEEMPLGNVGALFNLREKIGTEPFLLFNADTIFDVGLNRMVKSHKSKDGLVMFFTYPYDSGLLIAGKDLSVRVV